MTHTAAPTVSVHVMLFARYAEIMGADALALELPAPATVAHVVAALRARPGGAGLPVRPLCAVNLVQVPPEHPVASGDEIAILPPMAGG